MESKDNLDTKSSERLISDHKDEDIELMPDVKKTKWILVDDPIEAHFKSLDF